jgi:hypothetical protein
MNNSKLIPEINKKNGGANMLPTSFINQKVTGICAATIQQIANPRPISTEGILFVAVLSMVSFVKKLIMSG